jgi:hypothetical protein
MKSKLFNNLLLFSLFGTALGFFGMLYEGIVTIPKMLDTSMVRMIFWRDYYVAINPIAYYIPITPLATLVLVGLCFTGAKILPANRLCLAAVLQLAVLVITFYIVKVINPKMYFADIERYADVIPAKVILVNILSVVRLVLAATGLGLTFSAYVQTQKSV